MFRTKYKYNPKTLSYEKVKLTSRMLVGRLFAYLFIGGVFAFVVSILAFEFVDSPQEKAMLRELEQYKMQFQILNDRLDQYDYVLADMQERDDNVYRVIFESEPVSSNARKAGYGGIDRYAKLDGYRNSDLIIETTRRLDQIAGQLVVQSKSYDEIWELAKNKGKMMLAIPAIQPVAKGQGRLVSGYGSRFHPILKVRRMHWGIDFSAPKGTPIYATADGVIEYTGRRGTFGNLVVIDHGYGYKTQYAHMNNFAVKRKQKVKRGEIIGYVGSTGLSRAPHIHYEVLKDGNRIDPVNFFYNDFTPAEFEKILELAARDNQVLS
jgi:murein DD-endopeptidase MepM/ murein hydrolase activator NlpD